MHVIYDNIPIIEYFRHKGRLDGRKLYQLLQTQTGVTVSEYHFSEMPPTRVNEFGQWTLWLLWMAANGIVFGLAYKQFDEGKKYYYLRAILKGGLPWARASAAVLNFNCFLILLPVCRNLLSALRGVHCFGLIKSIFRLLDKNLTYHRHIAYMICIFSVIHIGAHVFNFERFAAAWDESQYALIYRLSFKFEDTSSSTWLNPIRQRGVDPNTELFKTVAGISGVIITLALVLMFTSSTELISGLVRKQVNTSSHDPVECQAEVNKHECPDPLFEATGATSWKWVTAPLALYFIERCIRFVRSLQNVKVTKVIKHPSNVLEIQMTKSRFHSEPGQYIFLHCSKISNLEWHPFTLTSCPEEDYFSVHIRIVGDWTSGLAKLFLDENEEQREERPRLAVDGPFGTSSTDFMKYSVCVFVGAGIGVTPFASILKTIWYQHNKSESSLNIKKIYFFWICRDTNAFEWFAELLESLEVQMVEKGNGDFLEYNMYLTRGWTNNEARNIMLRDQEEGEDVITGLKRKTFFGRPQWDGIFDNIAQSNPSTDIGVFFCGPSGLSHTLRNMSNKYSNAKEGIRFYYNKENF
ncbi:NADPH oxidase 3-like isoform X2 [Dendronephthya gigantea]|uniref:NADPH oxidase 3-like isoform X2 n=1 Tax=Dendronephthya gigantea TaxID=151771 RepID=UPI00106A5ABE|nr:NADPH oxidase 3-like isoform X2 [Dendronephthya gigantea]